MKDSFTESEVITQMAHLITFDRDYGKNRTPKEVAKEILTDFCEGLGLSISD